jgi:hypothetical protein
LSSSLANNRFRLLLAMGLFSFEVEDERARSNCTGHHANAPGWM